MARNLRILLCFVSISISRKLFIEAINNVALGKPAFQSSTHNAHEASKAVDGNINGDPDAGYCMHTSDGSDEFWEVDLGELYIIDHVKVYNRIDSYGERAKNVQVFVGFDQNKYVLCGYRQGLLGDLHTFQLDAHTYGRWVRITRNKVTDFLHLCEVEVYGILLTTGINVRLEQLPNKLGVGMVLGTSQGSSKVDCAVRCKTSNICIGFNFDTSNLECTTLVTATISDNILDNLHFYRKGKLGFYVI